MSCTLLPLRCTDLTFGKTHSKFYDDVLWTERILQAPLGRKKVTHGFIYGHAKSNNTVTMEVKKCQERVTACRRTEGHTQATSLCMLTWESTPLTEHREQGGGISYVLHLCPAFLLSWTSRRCSCILGSSPSRPCPAFTVRDRSA